MQSVEVGQIWRHQGKLWIVSKIDKSKFMDSMNRVTFQAYEGNDKSNSADLYITAQHSVLNTMNRCRSEEIKQKGIKLMPFQEEILDGLWQHTIGH